MTPKDHEIIIGDGNWSSGLHGMTSPTLCATRGMYTVARLATDMAARFALVAALPDGEDSAGRQKLRMATPDELASRACGIAHSLWVEFENRGWLFDIPLPTPKPKKERSEKESVD